MKNQFLLYLLFLLVFSSESYSKWTVYDKYNTGISFAEIRVINSDASNNIWFGGWHVAMFDGKNWNLENLLNIVGATFNSIAVDKKNNVWVGGMGSYIAKYNGTEWSFYEMPLDTGGRVFGMAVDSNNNVWIGNSSWESGQTNPGIFKFDGNNFTSYSFLTDTLVDYNINDIVVDKENVIWAIGRTFWGNDLGGATKSKLFRYKDSSWSIYTSQNSGYKIDQPNCLKIDSKNNLWIVGYDNIQKYDGIQWVDFKQQFDSIKIYDYKFYPYDVDFDTSGNLWIASFTGLYKFDMNNWSSYYKWNIGWEHGEVHSVHIDKKNRIWIGGLTEIAMFEGDPVNVTESVVRNNKISITPNPATNKIKIKSTQLTNDFQTIEITNYMGIKIKTKQFFSQIEIELDISGLPSGIYFATLKSGANIETQKFIIAK